MVAAMKEQWTDETLAEIKDMYGEQWSIATVLGILTSHQTHHRGQMTVLMRQAGLRVPGVYGPSREEWASIWWGSTSCITNKEACTTRQNVDFKT